MLMKASLILSLATWFLVLGGESARGDSSNSSDDLLTLARTLPQQNRAPAANLAAQGSQAYNQKTAPEVKALRDNLNSWNQLEGVLNDQKGKVTPDVPGVRPQKQALLSGFDEVSQKSQSGASAASQQNNRNPGRPLNPTGPLWQDVGRAAGQNKIAARTLKDDLTAPVTQTEKGAVNMMRNNIAQQLSKVQQAKQQLNNRISELERNMDANSRAALGNLLAGKACSDGGGGKSGSGAGGGGKSGGGSGGGLLGPLLLGALAGAATGALVGGLMNRSSTPGVTAAPASTAIPTADPAAPDTAAQVADWQQRLAASEAEKQKALQQANHAELRYQLQIVSDAELRRASARNTGSVYK